MDKEKELNFEEIMKKLEEITDRLEKEELNLDEAVKLFEEGMELSKQANKKLENAEKRITMIIDTETLQEENFIPEEWLYNDELLELKL